MDGKRHAGADWTDATLNPMVKADQWILEPRPSRNAVLRLFCFPYAGSGASVYNSWIDELPADISVCPVQFPGRENLHSRPPYLQLPPLVDELSGIVANHLDLPFVFYGHSMGALVGFELTRRLRKHQLRQPLHLLVSSYPAPQLAGHALMIHRLPDSEFLTQVRELRGTPDAVFGNSELIELVAPLLRADFASCESYVYYSEPPLECSISCFGGADDKRVSAEELSAWRSQTTGRFKMQLFPGDHFFLQSSRHLVLRVIAQELRDTLRMLRQGRQFLDSE